MKLPDSIEAILRASIFGRGREARYLAEAVAREACRLQREADVARIAQYHQVDGTPLVVSEPPQ